MTSRVLQTFAACTIALVLPFGLCTAAEQERSPLLTGRWGFTVGGFAVDLRTDAQFSFAGELGTLFRLEDDTDYQGNQSVLRADGFWRFGKRHALEMEVLE